MPSSRFSGSAIDWNTRNEGLRLSVGSWNTTWIRRRPRRGRELRLRHRGDILAAEQDLPRGGIDQPAEQAHQRGLAAAEFADQADAFSGPDGQIDIIDRVQLGAARRSLDGIEFGQRRWLRAAAPSQGKPAAHDMRRRQFGPGQLAFVADRLPAARSAR